MSQREWFGQWFDSPYYHILYQHRDDNEAKFFLDNLLGHLNPSLNCMMLDLACGKGRHAIYLNEQGFKVTGVDLSQQNIKHARQFENDRLQFHQHDMREVYKPEAFDFVFNLFTSFGYFDTIEEHERTIKAITKSLKPGGKFIIDFLNPYVVINHLVKEEIKMIDGIEFHINKDFDGTFIIKDIQFEHEGVHHHFQEKVKAIRRTEFIEFFQHAGLQIREIFGNYALEPYVADQSDRLIFIVAK
jgi:SAM-dependent methyltransferase